MTEVTCAIIIKEERVLITQRSESMPHPLKWEFPGGKVKEGESCEYSIRREIFEELGIKVIVKKRLPSVKHAYDTHSIELIPFICNMEEGKISLSEHRSYRWIPAKELESVNWLEADMDVVGIFLQANRKKSTEDHDQPEGLS